MPLTEAETLRIESWTLYSVALTIVGMRLASRSILLGGWKKLKFDDYLMMFIVVCYTIVTVGLNITAVNLSNFLAPGEAQTLTPAQVANAEYGSKWVVTCEHFQNATLWLTKVSLLTLYWQMTQGLPKQHRLCKYTFYYLLFGYCVSLIFYWAVWCRPATDYWHVPVSDPQCASYFHHIIMVSTFNISADIVMLLIPIPMLIKAQLPLRRKVILCGIFSLGILVILTAILNRYFNFTAPYGSLIYLNWYSGEGSTSVMVSNIPHCWPIISRVFRLGSFKNTSADPRSGFGGSAKGNTRQSRIRPDEHGYIRSESEERITKHGAAPTGFYDSRNHGGVGGKEMDDLELGTMSETKSGYIGTQVAGGQDNTGPRFRNDGVDKEEGIIKTVQMHQYADGDDGSRHRGDDGF